MNRIFPVEKRTAGEPVINEPSWSNASSLLFSEDGRLDGDYHPPAALISGEDEDEFLTVDGSEEEEYILSDERSVTSMVGESETYEVPPVSRNESVVDDYTRDPTPFGGVPVLKFESTAQKIDIIDDAEKSNVETIQGDEEDILEEIRSFSSQSRHASQASQSRSQEIVHPRLTEEDSEIESTALELEENNIESIDVDHQAELEETGYILKPELNEDNSTIDGSSPFSHEKFDADSDFVEHTKAESLPSSVLELLESAIDQAENKPTRQEEPVNDQTDLQAVVEDRDESDIPTSMGTLDQLGSPEEVQGFLDLKLMIAPPNQPVFEKHFLKRLSQTKK